MKQFNVNISSYDNGATATASVSKGARSISINLQYDAEGKRQTVADPEEPFTQDFFTHIDMLVAVMGAD